MKFHTLQPQYDNFLEVHGEYGAPLPPTAPATPATPASATTPKLLKAAVVAPHPQQPSCEEGAECGKPVLEEKTTPPRPLTPEEREKLTVQPIVTRGHPLTPTATKFVTPAPLVTPAVAVPQPPPKVERPDNMLAGEESAKRAAQALPKPWAEKLVVEPRNPTNHLIQEAMAEFKNVEARDVGSLAPGNELKYDYRVVLQKGTEVSAAGNVKRVPPLTDDKPDSVANAMRMLGAVAEALAVRVSDVDANNKKLLQLLFRDKSKPGTREDAERDQIELLTAQARKRRETEIAALVRDEVRLLTNQMNTELRILSTNFLSEIREILNGLRESLREEFVRSTEENRKMLALIKGDLPKGQRDLLDELTLMPVRQRENLNRIIGAKTNLAFSAAQSLVRQVMAAKNAFDREASEASDEEKAAAAEPSAAALFTAMRKSGDSMRERDAKELLKADGKTLREQAKLARLQAFSAATAFEANSVPAATEELDSTLFDTEFNDPLLKKAVKFSAAMEAEALRRSQKESELLKVLRKKQLEMQEATEEESEQSESSSK
jgi:hypothetical protein